MRLVSAVHSTFHETPPPTKQALHSATYSSARPHSSQCGSLRGRLLHCATRKSCELYILPPHQPNGATDWSAKHQGYCETLWSPATHGRILRAIYQAIFRVRRVVLWPRPRALDGATRRRRTRDPAHRKALSDRVLRMVRPSTPWPNKRLQRFPSHLTGHHSHLITRTRARIETAPSEALRLRRDVANRHVSQKHQR